MITHVFQGKNLERSYFHRFNLFKFKNKDELIVSLRESIDLVGKEIIKTDLIRREVEGMIALEMKWNRINFSEAITEVHKRIEEVESSNSITKEKLFELSVKIDTLLSVFSATKNLGD